MSKPHNATTCTPPKSLFPVEDAIFFLVRVLLRPLYQLGESWSRQGAGTADGDCLQGFPELAHMTAPYVHNAKVTVQLDEPPDRVIELEEYRATWLLRLLPSIQRGRQRAAQGDIVLRLDGAEGLALMLASRGSLVRSDFLSQDTRGRDAPRTLETAVITSLAPFCGVVDPALALYDAQGHSHA